MRNLQAYLHPDSEHWLDWFHRGLIRLAAENSKFEPLASHGIDPNGWHACSPGAGPCWWNFLLQGGSIQRYNLRRTFLVHSARGGRFKPPHDSLGIMLFLLQKNLLK
jgi:hypothetical protein